jgi:transglutaminase-like putative cysteine protease
MSSAVVRPYPPLVGPSWFGPAYATMFARDSHAPGSIDRILCERMVGLDGTTAPFLYGPFTARRSPYVPGLRPGLERRVEQLTRGRRTREEVVEAIVGFTHGLQPQPSPPLRDLRFGGTEEQIIARGSDFCNELARVAAGLLEIARVPARVVYLADTRRAYSGHAIVEAWRSATWGAADATTGVVYRRASGRPVSVWELKQEPRLIARHSRPRSAIFSRVGQFRRAALANYRLEPRRSSIYRTSRLNAYYRSILSMSDRGWPGGLRWLHGEAAG